MADDKPTLTRRRVLGGMATVGVAGAAGAGAWAGYSDTEVAETAANAGTLNLGLTSVPQFSDITGNQVTVDGSTLSVSIGEMAPGDLKTATIALENKGSVDANALGVEVTGVDSGEGDSPESETGSFGSEGELDNQIDMSVHWAGGSNLIGSAGHNVSSYDSSDFRDFSNVKQHNGPYIANDVDNLSAGDSNNYLKIHLHYKDLDPSENNQSQGDTLSFDLDITAYQNNQ
jgi:hypothetical protein